MTALAGPATAPLDVAMLPVWGWRPILGPGHLDPIGAAAAVRLLRPRFAVPIHWGTLAVAGLPAVPAGPERTCGVCLSIRRDGSPPPSITRAA